MRTLIAAAAAAVGAFALSPAMAAPTLGTFDLDSSTCGATTVCGTVTLATDATPDQLEVTINLTTGSNGFLFAKTGAGDPVDLSVAGVTAADVSISFPGGSLFSASGTSPSFALLCATCHGTSNMLTSLTFFVNDTAGLQNMNVLISEMDIGGPGCFPGMTGDCSNTSPRTITSQTCAPGIVCTQGTPTPIPEPLTLSLFGAGLAGLGALRRRTKKSA